MLIYINQWTKNLNNIKFLNTHPVEKDSILGSYSVISEEFSNIEIYSKAPLPAPLSPSPLQAHPSPPHPHPTAPAAAPVTSAAGATVGGSAQKKKKAVEHSGTSCNTTCTCANSSSPSTCSAWHVLIEGQKSCAWLTSECCMWTCCSKAWQSLVPFQHVQRPLPSIYCGCGWAKGCSGSPPPPHPTNLPPHWLTFKLNNSRILPPVVQRPVPLYH